MKLKHLFGTAVIGAMPCVLPVMAAAETGDWSFGVAPYLWAASVEVETSLPGTPAGVSRFESSIAGGAMLAAGAHYGSFGLLVDFAWLRLETEALQPGPGFSAVDLKSDFIHTTAAFSYRLPSSGKFQVDLLAGARLWYVSEDIEFTSGVLPGFQASGDKTWVDPVIGADVRYELSPRWFLTTKGTVGGFGVSSDIAWELLAGVGWRISDGWSTLLGYRYLHEDYSQDAFDFKLDAHGLLLGFAYRF